MAVLVVAEHDHAQVKPATLNAVTAGLAIDSAVTVLVAGNECQPAAEAAARAQGVARVLCCDDPRYAHHLAEELAVLVAGLADDYTHILAPATTFGKNFAPRVGALVDVAPISDITAVQSADTFERLIYAGNAVATVQSTDPLKLMTVRATAFDAVAADGGNAEVAALAAPGEACALTHFVGQELTQSERPELTAAKVVISGGRGLGGAENFALIEEIADKLGAAVGASRAAVDAGYVPNDYQVGQTGKVVAPELYIAVGISGAIQHLAGMKDSKVIVAINKDEEAPIFQVADYGLVGDLFEILPQLSAELDRVGG